MNRRKAREEVFTILFERRFNPEIPAEEFYQGAIASREIEDDEYIRSVFFGVEENKKELDERSDKFFNNWKRSRISAVSESVIRIAVYEMMHTEIPHRVSINEAIELSKKFDDDKAKNFINGVLNSVSKELEAGNE